MTNTEFVADLYALFERRDVDAYLAMLAPDVTWIEYIAPPYGGTFVGREAVRRCVLNPILNDWNDFVITTEEIIEGGDYVVVTSTVTGTYRATGKRLRIPSCHVWKIKDGQVVQLKHFTEMSLMEDVL